MNRPPLFLLRWPLLALLLLSPQPRTARAQAFTDADWLPLGSGLNNTVEALAVSGNTLYAGGIFPRGGSGQVLNDIAQWNGSTWSALGSGVVQDSSNVNAAGVNALAVLGTTLYAGGIFTNAGGVYATNIAQWNGTNWSALGSGIFNNSGFGGYVAALAVSSNTLYAGGWFLTAGGVPAKYIAQWNASTWSALGAGMSSTVNALAVSGSKLYAAGRSPRRAASRLDTLPNGMGALGRPSLWG